MKKFTDDQIRVVAVQLSDANGDEINQGYIDWAEELLVRADAVAPWRQEWISKRVGDGIVVSSGTTSHVFGADMAELIEMRDSTLAAINEMEKK